MQDAKNDGSPSQAARNTPPLNVVAKWSTPKGRDHRTGMGSRLGPRQDAGLPVDLNDQVGGQLNPTWVEWLMNWPLGWTSLDSLPRQNWDAWVDNQQWWDQEPDVPRVARGVPDRVNRLKALGNGQVPAVAAAAWRLLTQ